MLVQLRRGAAPGACRPDLFGRRATSAQLRSLPRNGSLLRLCHRSLNAANWQWLSASAFFSQYFRVYSPIRCVLASMFFECVSVIVHCCSCSTYIRCLPQVLARLAAPSCCSFGKQYDKNGDYIRHFLPVLKVGRLPDKLSACLDSPLSSSPPQLVLPCARQLSHSRE
jgi:hypothetical protein